MPGILGIVQSAPRSPLPTLPSLDAIEPGRRWKYVTAAFGQACFGLISNKRFNQDRFFDSETDTLTCFDGILFNRYEICRKNTAGDLGNVLLKMNNHNATSIINEFRGNFVGCVYKKSTNELCIFNDHLSSKPLYYYFDKTSATLFFASRQFALVRLLRDASIKIHLDETGAYYLLSFGFMLGDTTLVSEIKKLPPAHVLTFSSGTLRLHQYYQLHSEPYVTAPLPSILSEMDDRFSKAINDEYKKDAEYGYNHLTTLSGGLDSRMNLGYALKLGYNNTTCVTFSESGYLDEIIAREICNDHHLPLIFYPLDSGNYLLKNIDQIIKANDGLIVYAGSAHLYNCLRSISFSDHGLLHTGMIGDLVVGSYLEGSSHLPTSKKTLAHVAFSQKLLSRISGQSEKIIGRYPNGELFAFYEKCINAVFNGYRMIEQFSEYASPFLHIDFLDYTMKIPPSLRYRQKIYLAWMKRFMPGLTRYRWEKYGMRPRYPLVAMEYYAKVKALIKHVTNARSSSMNPMQYWWKHNSALGNQLANIFNNDISNIQVSSELRKDCKQLYMTGTPIEKMQVITLLRTISLQSLTT